MEQVTLYTRAGEVVTTIEMPRFTPPAEVVIWGERFFVWREGRYVEGMAWYSPPSQGR